MRHFLFILISLLCWQTAAADETQPWKTLQPGLDYIELTHLSNTYATGTLNAFRIDLNRYDLSLGLAKDLQKNTTSVKELVTQKQALLGINGGFFTPEFTPLGLRIRDQKVINPLSATNWWGIFLIKDQQAEIILQKNYQATADTQFAIQSGPRLLINGNIPPLKPGEAERSALCITRDKRVIIAASKYLPMTTTALANILKSQLNCNDAINLDGGQSTQLYANIPPFNLDIRYFSTITDAIIVKPKS